MKNRITAAILAFCLGGLGIHYFYLGNTGKGILSLLFCWTLIPGIVAFIKFITFLTMTDEKFNSLYNNSEMKNTVSKPKLSIIIIAGVFSIFIFIFLIAFIGGGFEESTLQSLNKIEHQVAMDMIKQYEIAKRNGSNMDAYVQAAMVAAAFLQAKDEVNYKKWKQIESREAKSVGL